MAVMCKKEFVQRYVSGQSNAIDISFETSIKHALIAWDKIEEEFKKSDDLKPVKG